MDEWSEFRCQCLSGFTGKTCADGQLKILIRDEYVLLSVSFDCEIHASVSVGFVRSRPVNPGSSMNSVICDGAITLLSVHLIFLGKLSEIVAVCERKAEEFHDILKAE